MIGKGARGLRMVKIGVELVNIGGKQAKNGQKNEGVWATRRRRVNPRASSSHASGMDPNHPFQDSDSPRFMVLVLTSSVVPVFPDWLQAVEIIIGRWARWESASILVAVRSSPVDGSLSLIHLEFYWYPQYPFQDSNSPCFVVPVLTSFVVPVFPDCPQAAEIIIRKCIF
ncbi:uncharacterized protein G2W53_014441 [Senna tora]|uniref:Uncharacterized protein n=1 Tax=Senna tora TaxID=362788 RepID=A0A834WTK5_9FABA|nr:uncharacterized protein G2W53_014441 [Senna tora]